MRCSVLFARSLQHTSIEAATVAASEAECDACSSTMHGISAWLCMSNRATVIADCNLQSPARLAGEHIAGGMGHLSVHRDLDSDDSRRTTIAPRTLRKPYLFHGRFASSSAFLDCTMTTSWTEFHPVVITSELHRKDVNCRCQLSGIGLAKEKPVCIITSAKEVMFLVALVYLFVIRITHKVMNGFWFPGEARCIPRVVE